MYEIYDVLLLCQVGQVRVTVLARSTEYRRIINQQEVNALSLSLLIIDLSLCFLNCPFKLLFAEDPCLVKSLDLLGLCPHECEVSLITF